MQVISLYVDGCVEHKRLLYLHPPVLAADWMDLHRVNGVKNYFFNTLPS